MVSIWLAPVNVFAAALIMALRLPSWRLLSTAVSGNVAWVSKATIVTFGGTESTAAFELIKFTVRFVGKLPEILTIPVSVLPSCTVAGRTSAKSRVSLSTTVSWLVASGPLSSRAINMTEIFPSIWLSSDAFTVKTACVCPAGTVR